MGNNSVCTRHDCYYFSSEAPRACGYNNITGEKRLTPIIRCDKYAPQTKQIPRGEKNMPETTKKKRTNWRLVLNEVESGSCLDDVAKNYGLTTAQLELGITKRRWYENAKTSNRIATDVNKKSKNKLPTAPTKTAKASNLPTAEMSKQQESVTMATLALGEQSNPNVQERLVCETFNRISKIMGFFTEDDNANVKGAALVTVREIIKQASAQVEV